MATNVQPALGSGLTIEDIDEWIADVQGGRWDTHHYPNEWAREGLAELLGEPVAPRAWMKADLLPVLIKARAAAQS